MVSYPDHVVYCVFSGEDCPEYSFDAFIISSDVCYFHFTNCRLCVEAHAYLHSMDISFRKVSLSDIYSADRHAGLLFFTFVDDFV